MIVLSRHRKQGRAELARRALVRAQEVVDAVWAKIGQPIYWSAEDTYIVHRVGELYVVGFEDPSLPETVERPSGTTSHLWTLMPSDFQQDLLYGEPEEPAEEADCGS